MVTSPVPHVTSKTSRASLLQGKFITTANIKPGTQSIQPAGAGSITLIQVSFHKRKHEIQYNER